MKQGFFQQVGISGSSIQKAQSGTEKKEQRRAIKMIRYMEMLPYIKKY